MCIYTVTLKIIMFLSLPKYYRVQIFLILFAYRHIKKHLGEQTLNANGSKDLKDVADGDNSKGNALKLCPL